MFGAATGLGSRGFGVSIRDPCLSFSAVPLPHLESLLLQSGALVPPLLDQASHTCSTRAAVSPEMVVVSESVHPRGLDFANQRKVVILRDVHGLTFPQIARKVKNLAGKRPSRRTCGQYYRLFSHQQGRKQSGYKKCGRRPWKLTEDSKNFLLRRLKKLRQELVCTSKTLQTELAKEKGVEVEESTVRKFLLSQGYKWLPRGQKRKYSAQQMRERQAFAQSVLNLGARRLREKLSFSMDGCVLTMPPRDLTDRLNHLRHSQTHMWRLRSERLEPSLAGQDGFSKHARLTDVSLYGVASAQVGSQL